MNFFRLGAAGCLVLTAISTPSIAQNNDAPSGAPPADYLVLLKECLAITDDQERLACFDSTVGSVVAASDAGDVRIVDREDVRQTRRKLFGLSLPKINLFGGGDDEDDEASDLLETSITSVRYMGRRGVSFTTPEGATWQIRIIPRRLRTIEPGDTVVFKKASLGSYFIRINGQIGVKGIRID